MNNAFPVLVIFVSCLFGCIGDDFLDDQVDPELRFTNTLDTLAVGESYQFEVQFFNNIGKKEEAEVFWNSSNNDIALVDDNGLVWAMAKGKTDISVVTTYEGVELSSTGLS